MLQKHDSTPQTNIRREPEVDRSFQRVGRADEFDEAPALSCQCRRRSAILNVAFGHPVLRISGRMNPAQYWLSGGLLDCPDPQRQSRTVKSKFPRLPSLTALNEPRVAFLKIHLWRAGHYYPVPRLSALQKLSDCERWILLQLEIEAADIEPGQVHTIVETVAINIFREIFALPFGEMAVKHQI